MEVDAMVDPNRTGMEAKNRQPDEPDPRDEPPQVANEERRPATPYVSALVALLGAWIVLSVFVYDVATGTFWNNLVVGGVVVLAGGFNYYRQRNDIPLSTGVAALATVCGLWLLVAPVAFEMATGAFWSTVVTGLLIGALAGYTTFEAREARAVTAEGTGSRFL